MREARNQDMEGEDSPKASKSAEKFVVRLPHGMRRRIADAARCYRRSMNSEIVARLEQSLNSGSAPYPVHDDGDAAADTGVADGRPAGDADLEATLLRIFRSLSPERRRALLALFD
ncbi:MAG TPA: Arc family DNA-binding protein [Pseudomonadales bacterium]|nr:Arc family DNA-binding protein [Pseudomonadales bacterium]